MVPLYAIFIFFDVANGYINMGPYIQQILDIHNDVRRMEPAANMHSMRWNTQLENEATMWASNCMFDHQQQGRGENLAMHTAPWDYARLIQTGIQMWADEKQYYTYGSSGFSKATGHYTQMIWAETTDVGCGMTRCPSLSMGGGTPMHDAWFLVCFYSPPGNFIGQLPFIQGAQCSQCAAGQFCDRGLCSASPSSTGPSHGGGAPGGHMGGGGGPMGGGSGGPMGGGSGGPMGGGGGGPMGGHGGQMGGGGGGGGPMGSHGGHMGGGGGGPMGGSGGPMGGGGGSGGPMGGGGGPSGHGGGHIGGGPAGSHQGGPSSGGNMGHGPSPTTAPGNMPGVIGGGPGMPKIEFIGGFPVISVGGPSPSGGGAGVSTGPTSGTGGGPQGNQPPSGSVITSQTPGGGTIKIWGFSTGSQNMPSGGGSGGSCIDKQSWCVTWAELCTDPTHSTKISGQCPKTCGKCQSAGAPPPTCVDAIEGCIFWKQIGMCNVPFYQTYITETCARTCNMC